MSVDISAAHLCNHQYSQGREHSVTLQSSLFSRSPQAVTSLAVPFLELHVNGIGLYVLSCLASFVQHHVLTFVHYCVYRYHIPVLNCRGVFIVWTCTILYSLVEGRLVCVQCLAVNAEACYECL